MHTYYKLICLLSIFLCSINANAQQTAKEFFDKGDEEYNSGHYSNALTAFNKAIALDSTQAPYYYHRGMVYFHIQKFDKALIDFDACILRNPYHADAYGMRSRIKYQMKDYDGAVKDHDISKDLQKPKGTQSLLAWDYAKKGDLTRAGLSWVRQFKNGYTHKYDLEAIKLWCDNQQMKGDTFSVDIRIFAFEIEGYVHCQKKLFEKGVDNFERAHKLLMDAPDSCDYLSSHIEELDYSLYRKWSEILAKDKKYSQAISIWGDLQQRKPQSWKIDFAIAQLQLAKGDNIGVFESVKSAFSKGMSWETLATDPALLQATQSSAEFPALQKQYPLPKEEEHQDK